MGPEEIKMGSDGIQNTNFIITEGTGGFLRMYVINN